MSYRLLLKTSLLLHVQISEHATTTGFMILSINTSQTSDGLCDEDSANIPLRIGCGAISILAGAAGCHEFFDQELGRIIPSFHLNLCIPHYCQD